MKMCPYEYHGNLFYTIIWNVSSLTIYYTKDTMVTYFMKCVLTHNIQYKGYHGNLLYHQSRCVLTIYNTKDTMVTYFIPLHEMYPYEYHGNLFYTITWNVSLLTICNTKDTMVTYLISSHENVSLRIPW